jgi:hypothetical protein
VRITKNIDMYYHLKKNKAFKKPLLPRKLKNRKICRICEENGILNNQLKKINTVVMKSVLHRIA